MLREALTGCWAFLSFKHGVVGLALAIAGLGSSQANLSAQANNVVASLTVLECDSSGCSIPVAGFAMRYRTDPANDIRIITDSSGYSESAFLFEPTDGVLIIPEFGSVNISSATRDISCVSAGVELLITALDNESANQMYFLDTTELADIDCTILLNTDRVGTDEPVVQLPDTGVGLSESPASPDAVLALGLAAILGSLLLRSRSSSRRSI